MDKAEWRMAWERILPKLSFEDKYKIAEARNVRPVNGKRLAKINKNSYDDYQAMFVVLWHDLLNQRKNKKIFLSWLNPYRNEESASRYDEKRIKAVLQENAEGEEYEEKKLRILAALLLTRLPELQNIALDYLQSLPPIDHEELTDEYINELQSRIHALERSNDSLQKKVNALETRAKKADERLQDSLSKQNQLKQRASNLENENNKLYKERARLEKDFHCLQEKQGNHQEDIQKRLEAAYSKGRVCWVRRTPHPFEESAPSLAVYAFQFGSCTNEDYKAISNYLRQNKIHEILVDPAVIPQADVLLMQKLIQKQELAVIVVKQAEGKTLATVKEL